MNMMLLLNIVITLTVIFNEGASSADLRCWTVTEQQHYTDQGLNQAPFNDLDSCINHCLSLPQCSIVDFDTETSPKCWVQKKIFLPTRTALRPKKSVTNYMLDRKCKGLLPAVDIGCWSVTPKMHYTDLGLDQVPLNDLFSCLNHCIGLPQCGAVDFDEATKPKCWVQLKTFEVKTSALKPKDTVTNYILKRSCLKPQNLFGVSKYLQQCWREKPRYHYTGLGLDPMPFNDVSSCASSCLSLPQCGTIDIDLNTNPICWVQKKTFAVDDKDIKPLASATNYVLDRNCYNGLLEQDLQCWISTPKMHYTDQGLNQTSFNDLGSCLAYCNSLPQCAAIDMDTETSGKCWVQRGLFEATKKALKPKNSVTNYLLDKYCRDLTSTVDLSCWTVNNRQHYTGLGLNQVPVNDLKDCLVYCLTQPNCHAVDFDSATNPKCWVQKKVFEINIKEVKPKESNINFLLKRSCYKVVDTPKPSKVPERPALSKDSSLSAVMSCWLTRNDTGYLYPEVFKPVSPKTLKECLLHCYSLPNCKVATFEWSSQSPCKIMETDKEVSLSNFKRSPGTASFVYNKACSSPKN